MSAAQPMIDGPATEPSSSVNVPELLVELPSRSRVFFSNLRDLFFPRPLAPLELRSEPAEFWPDVFVKRSLPWSRFLQSSAYHVLAGAILVGLTHLFALKPRVVEKPRFDHSQVIYYQASDYLPPLDTRTEPSPRPKKADPELSKQPIISVPREAENSLQTIVAPPSIRLKRNLAMPNIVAWRDAAKKPRLAIPEAPLTPASDITRLAPKMDSSVVTPPPDATRLSQRRASPALQNSVVAPPPDVRASNSHAAAPGLQPNLIAPPPTVDAASVRRLGNFNISSSSVIAPAPQLPLEAQRTAPGGRLTGSVAPEVVPPPPLLPDSGSAGAAGSPGHLIALNLHPAVGAPPDPSAANRRGAFAATPEGHSGASGTPGSTTGSASHANGSSAAGTPSKVNDSVPAGLYVGAPAAKPAAVAGDPAGKTVTDSVNPNLIASVRPPRVSSGRAMQPDDSAKLSEAERSVFGGRRFYSVMVNMPNLNSGGGSWVIRFAELNHESGPHDSQSPAPELSQPMATREVDPAYPTQLMRQNVQGTVILYAIIHADGTVGNVRVLRSADERLDRFASEAVSQWKFEPATKNGVPVDVEATFKIPFRPTHIGNSF